MKRRNLLLVGLIIVLSSFAFFVPISFNSNNSVPICILPKASAQDNLPCLVQEATNSALQVQILQLQSTNVALQSTLTALENSQNAPTTNGEISNTSESGNTLPFIEDFSSNQNGWDLTANDLGAVRISQGELLISTPNQTFKPVFAPNVTVEDEFYAQVEITPLQWSMTVVMILGNPATKTWNTFNIYNGRTVQFFDGDTLLFHTDYQSLWEPNKKFILGVEALKGLYTLYVNDKATESSQIEPHGHSIGLGVWNGSARFDNLVIRANR